MARLTLTGMGVVLLWAALTCAGYAAGWQIHKARAQSILLRSERAAMHRARQKDPHGACVVTAPRSGQLAGILRIPALHLTAPVEEGTGDGQLNVAVGHDPSSVWPGQAGTSVLLAHDVSYFVHLDELKSGDVVLYESACTIVRYTVTGEHVVQQGSPVPDSATPSLVLDTCYPPNALFFTTQRLLVQASEQGIADSAREGRPRVNHTSPGWTFYSVPAPVALVAQGLTLEQNEAPMGTMTLSGQMTANWEQSPGPLALEAASLEAYFGGIHAAEQLRPDWWAPIAGPDVAPPVPLLGVTIAGHDAPLDVEIHASDDEATRVVLRTTVAVSGGAAPGTYSEVVTVAVHGSSVHLGSWVMTPV